MQTQTFHIQGMTCGGCANSVQKVLNAQAGVAQVQVDWQNGTAVVQWDDTQTPVAVLVAAIEDAGFDVHHVA